MAEEGVEESGGRGGREDQEQRSRDRDPTRNTVAGVAGVVLGGIVTTQRTAAIAVLALLVSGASLIAWQCYAASETHRRESVLTALTWILVSSPLLFVAGRRLVRRQPAILLLCWWVFPITCLAIGIRHIASEGSVNQFHGFSCLLASLWAMFGPIVVYGIAQAVADAKSPRAEEASENRGGI